MIGSHRDRTDVAMRGTGRTPGLGEVGLVAPPCPGRIGDRGAGIGMARQGRDLVIPRTAAAVSAATWLGAQAGARATCPGEPARTKRDEILAFIAARAACPDLTPGTIARQTGVSRTVLYRMLQPFGGVATIVQRQRLLTMCSALADPGDARSIEAIAHDSGVRSLSHAIRMFQRAFGMTPGAFRRASAVGRVPAADRSAA